MDTTTLIFVIIGAFTVSSWFMRLVDYLEGGKCNDVYVRILRKPV